MTKLSKTQDSIMLLLDASGEQSVGQILAECKTQAYPQYMAEALRILVANNRIYFDHDEQVFLAL